MYPVKNRKWWFFGLNMKFSICIDNTRKNSKFPPWGKGQRDCDCLPTFQTISQKISILETFLINSLESLQTIPFPPSPLRELGNFCCLVMFKSKNHHFRFFIGYMMDHFLSLGWLNSQLTLNYHTPQLCCRAWRNEKFLLAKIGGLCARANFVAIS